MDYRKIIINSFRLYLAPLTGAYNGYPELTKLIRNKMTQSSREN